MASGSASFKWPHRLGLGLAAGLGALAFAQAVRSGGETSPRPPDLVESEPMTQADARLIAAGWAPDPDREPLPFERKLAGNSLASLSACSGTGLGFCRYDYKRGSQTIAVITIPGASGEGIVHLGL
jgi:hypothetical protein